MRKEVEGKKSRIKLNQEKKRFHYDEFGEITDKLAKMMNLLPDLEEIKKNDPQLFKILNDNVSIPAKPEPALELMNEIEKIYNEEYKFADPKNITFAEKAKLFHERFNIKTNFIK
jgi:hypothetical protein